MCPLKKDMYILAMILVLLHTIEKSFYIKGKNKNHSIVSGVKIIDILDK